MIRGVSFIDYARIMRDIPKTIVKTIKRKSSFIWNIGKPRFTCPICYYRGYFEDVSPATGRRKFCRCPMCGSAERQRLQKLVLDQILNTIDTAQLKVLHFAPKAFFESYFRKKFLSYLSADLLMDRVDVKCDICNLPFSNNEFDFVFASHVLEHIQDDLSALNEIKRILKPGGIAILPVPVVNKITIEYPQPNEQESGHVRAPGEDYFLRYKKVFSQVKIFSSSDFPKKYQTFLYEDRSHYPNELSPLREASYDERYNDFVPICTY